MAIGPQVQDPHLLYNKDGSLSVASGREAVEIVRVASLISAIKMMRTTRLIPPAYYPERTPHYE